jgi:hypothetical protein
MYKILLKMKSNRFIYWQFYLACCSSLHNPVSGTGRYHQQKIIPF